MAEILRKKYNGLDEAIFKIKAMDITGKKIRDFDVTFDEFSKSNTMYWKIVIDGETYDSTSLSREDEDAIFILEEFGSEFCSCGCSSLKIEEYDDDNYDYCIEKHDGYEELKLTPVVKIDKLVGKSAGEMREYLSNLGIKVKEVA